MDPLHIVTLSALAAVVLIMAGFHITIALGLTSFAGLWAISGNASVPVNLVSTTLFNVLQSYELGTIPMFVLMGAVMTGGLSSELFAAANVFLRRIRGGLAMATVIGNAIFSALTGSTMAGAAAFSKIAYPPMVAHGYDRRFAVGCIAGSSILGQLIPPSILFIVYGLMTQVSIGKLLIAGVMPGLLLALLFCLGIAVMLKLNPRLIQEPAHPPGAEGHAGSSMREDLQTLLKIWPVILLIVVVLGGIYSGYFTPTESAAVGAAGAILIAASKKQLTLGRLREAVVEVGIATGAMCLLLIMAQLYSRMAALSGLIQGLEGLLAGLAVPPFVVLSVVMLIVLILGTILDSISTLLLIVPVAFPVLVKLGYDPIQLGVLIVLATEMGQVTPPFGMSVFTVKASLRDAVTIDEIYAGSMPFLLMMLVCLVLCMVFPGISTWLTTFM